MQRKMLLDKTFRTSIYALKCKHRQIRIKGSLGDAQNCASVLYLGYRYNQKSFQCLSALRTFCVCFLQYTMSTK